MATNIVVAAFGGSKVVRTRALYQWDYGQVLQFEGLDLPSAYTVHFSNVGVGGTAKTQVGNADGVDIPDEYLTTGQTVYAWVYLHAGADDGETVYAVIIPVTQRPQPTEDEPTPVQQGMIDQAIAALSAGVEAAEDAAESAEQIAENLGDFETAMAAVEAAKTDAEQSASEAAGSATAAATSEDNAAGSATAAAGSASSAAGSASGAASSATAAAGSATAAASSAAAAAASEAAAQAVQESIPSDYSTLSSDVSDLKTAINDMPIEKDSDAEDADLDISDLSGNVIARFANGGIRVKNFDSSDVGNLDDLTTTEKGSLVGAINEAATTGGTQTMIAPTEDSATASMEHIPGTSSEYFILSDVLYQATTDIAIGDTITAGTNCAAVSDGIGGEVSELRSAVNKSATVSETAETNVDLDVTDTTGNVLVRFKDGHIKTKNFDSSQGNSLVKGKVIVNFGDSIFGNKRPPNDISTAIANATGATVYNCGFGGCRMANHDYSRLNTWGKFSMWELANAVASGDWSEQEAAIDDPTFAAEMPTYFPETLELLEGIDFSEVDIVTIAYGTNDFTAAIPLDNTENKLSTATFAGALRYSIETLLTAYPNLRIICCGQCYRWWDNSGVFVDDSNTHEVGGQTLPEFVQKTSDVAKEYNLPFIDNYNIGIGKFSRSYYFSGGDTTHPNNIGTKLIADHIVHELF